DGLAGRRAVADLLAAWEAAKLQWHRENAIRAEARATSQNILISGPEHASLRNAFEKKWGELPNDEVPGRHYPSMKLEQIEQNEPRPESLMEVASKEDKEEDFLSTEVDNNNRLVVKKGAAAQLRIPQSPEELRVRLRVLGNAWMFGAMKFNRPWLAGLTPTLWQRYADYALGKKVALLPAIGPDGEVADGPRPPWRSVLSYEFELRKMAYDQVRQDSTMAEGLKAALQDAELRSLHFIGPLTRQQNTVDSNKRQRTEDPGLCTGTEALALSNYEQFFDLPRGAASLDRLRKGDGKCSKGKKHWNTPDGRAICFKFNNKGQKCSGNCGRAHVCQVCFSDQHPAYDWTGAPEVVVKPSGGLRVLYLFVGKQRRGDIRYWLTQLCRSADVPLCMREVDVLRPPQDAVTDQHVWGPLVTEIAHGAFDVILATPSSSAHSRAHWSTSPGPRPLRNSEFSKGFPWLEGGKRKKVQVANESLDRIAAAIREGCRSPARSARWLEFPEDLGRVATWNQRPASIWQPEEEMRRLALETDATTAAFFQCRWPGVHRRRPTRTASTLLGHHAFGAQGWPQFSPDGVYLGPLPQHCGHDHEDLLGKGGDGDAFRTTKATAYPSPMCRDIAKLVLAHFLEVRRSLPEGGGRAAAAPTRVTLAAARPDDHESMYIGRGTATLPKSKWHNPFKVAELGRDACLKRFEEYARRELWEDLEELAGKSLACHCREGQSCHGDVLVKLFKEKGAGKELRESPPEVDGRDASPESRDGGRRARLGEGPWGNGPPAEVGSAGKPKRFVDGAGLCSLGRWAPESRNCATPPWLARLQGTFRSIVQGLEDPMKIFARLACGGVEGPPFPDAAVQQARDAWLSELRVASGRVDLAEVPERQPFFLKALGVHLKEVGDPDWRIFEDSKDSFTSGVALGFGELMPRTPAVFERKVHWRRYDRDVVEGLPEDKGNYVSAIGRAGEIRTQFEEEVREGLMSRMPLADARREFGPRLHVAALAALEKGTDSFRLVHDGTHGVRINPNIKPRDQVRQPGIDELRWILGRSRAEGLPLIALKADVRRAHRLVRVARRDWGCQACALPNDPDHVYLNAVGTFGIASAGYWWARLASAISRSVHGFVGKAEFWQLLFADDFPWLFSGRRLHEDALLVLLWFLVVGTPFSRGGTFIEWVGIQIDLSHRSLGISARRVEWVQRWIRDILFEGQVLMSAFGEALGRLSFAVQALPCYRPLLAPLYSWAAAAPAGAYLGIPPVVRLVLEFFADRLLADGGARPCWPRCKPAQGAVEWFRSDAKAEGDDIGIGGRECRGGVAPADARWFHVKLTRANAPWAFRAGEPFRVIAALEMYGTLISCMVFLPEASLQGDAGRLLLSGTTDNKGNSYVVQRLFTTKFPLCAFVMELAAQLQRWQAELHLDWTPREQNVEADELSEGVFRRFTESKRIIVDPASLEFVLLPKVLETGASLVDFVKEQRGQQKRQASTELPKRPRRPRLRETDPCPGPPPCPEAVSSRSSSRALDEFRRFCLNWLHVFEECSIDPGQNPKVVVTEEQLLQCSNIAEIADLCLESASA
ncbi:unnamed protein product, partial [Prorocentrum cordatum]